MDPVSITGLIIAVEQIVSAIYKYGKGVKDAKMESKQLCSELFALKAALEHVRMSAQIIIDSDQSLEDPTASSLFQSPQFNDMLMTAKSMLEDLSKRLVGVGGSVSSALNSMAWPFKKDDINKELTRLERLKSYFVLATTTDNMTLCHQMFLEIRSIAATLNERQEQHKIESQAELQDSILQWLAPYDPTQLYRQALPVEEIGTGRWFLDGPFNTWYSDTSPAILWLKGKPGCGKTTLTAASIRTSQGSRPKDGKTAYFFCSFTDLQSQSLENMLGSFLAQLCDVETDIWKTLTNMYQSEKSQTPGRPKPPSTDDLKGLLKDVCQETSSVHLFIDAINESKEANQLLTVMLSIAQEIPALKIMISSTEDLGLPSEDATSDSITTVVMKTRYIDHDIRQYVESRLQFHERFKHLPPSLKSNIMHTLHTQANGSFRWVQCQLETLVLQKTPRALKATLDGVPPTLEQTYCNILTDISKEDRPLVKNALLWLAFSVRSLRFDELCEALTIDEHSGYVDEDARLLQPMDLLKICSSLVSYNADRQTVVLAHSSVLTYLQSEQIKASEAREFFIDTSDIDNVLLRRCLTYLCSPTFRTGYCQTKDKLDQKFDQWPFLDYCVEAWPIHARYINMDDPTREILLRFFETSTYPRCGNFGAWVQAYLPSAKMNIENSTPLYYAARFNLNSIVRLILQVQGTATLEARDGRRGSTPLHVACYSASWEVVQSLLEAGANAGEVNEMGETGLRWAAARGSEEMVRLLLSAGADVNYRNWDGRTPLYYAMVKKHLKCALALLEAGAASENLDGSGHDVAYFAHELSRGGSELVESLSQSQ